MTQLGTLGTPDRFQLRMTRSPAEINGSTVSDRVNAILNPSDSNDIRQLLMNLTVEDWDILLNSLGLNYKSNIYNGKIYISKPVSFSGKKV